MLSPLAARHIHTPMNVGPLEGATHYGVSGTPGDGPYIELWFTIADDVIKATAHRANGCFSSIASASVVAEILQGKSVFQALSLVAKDVDALLGGLPEGKGYCAEMAVEAVYTALRGEPQ